jgi:hypothetical protein
VNATGVMRFAESFPFHKIILLTVNYIDVNIL